ncbi:PREDICTED: uncharacterized protein LOC104799649 [Tarenaya hassleriana]|uniref:uncharacterized protein LOC104799649 n=1 Tax=Tarenaya hassleriana TaxID=28532 RepID=UPI00053C5634|nr:PREDICTED: uncharacterized protein LOC104799649 [Tarenaya hassleriana]
MSLKLLVLPQYSISNRNPPENPRFYHPRTRPVSGIRCIRRAFDGIENRRRKRMSDSELAKDLAREIAKADTLSDQRREAMKKSREILWGEFCRHMCLKEDELRNKWGRIEEDEKWVLVRGFVGEWGADFQPLSVRSVKEMVEEECLDAEKMIRSQSSSSLSSFSGWFPGLKRIIGFE